MNSTPSSASTRLQIWQQNLNKSRAAQEDLINSNIHSDYDIILLQEPYIDSLGNTKATRNWRVIYPTSHLTDTSPPRAVILINKAIDTNQWEQLAIPNTRDIAAIQIRGDFGRISIYDIYNDCHNSDALDSLNVVLSQHNTREGHRNLPEYMMWGGDFNRHHPMWDEARNHHLFTARALRDAEALISLIAENNMAMLLPGGIPTLESMATKNWTRPDNVFGSELLEDKVIYCTTDPRLRGPGTDHVPILTSLDLPIAKTTDPSTYNWRAVEWDTFKEELTVRLTDIPAPGILGTKEEFQGAVRHLTETLQDTIRTTVPQSRPSPYKKRWWSTKLAALKKSKNKLSSTSYKYRAISDHPSHEEHRKIRQQYAKEILTAKHEHWKSFLEEMSHSEIWIANRYISSDGGDGGKTRIPTLTSLTPGAATGRMATATSNEEKSRMLAKAMFPKKPDERFAPDQGNYANQITTRREITETQIRRHLMHVSPYKAPGPDEISNVVLKNCADLIIPYLLQIFRAAVRLRTYPDEWRDTITCVLRKPGKARYDVPKAYRPIALSNTMAKLLSAIIAEDITYLAEKHQLLPANHFGGRPGRTTTDSIHLLVDTIKAAWRRKQVASVLFLDVEGAFPNAVPERLLHNLRSRRVPEKYVIFVKNMLMNRRTRLKFDDYLSDWFTLDNGIGQGDPLSMILYLFYNSDMIEIPSGKHEMGLGYVDDMALVATAKSFDKSHRMIKNMMTRQNGGNDWSMSHNSRFELSKLVLVDFTRSRRITRTPMKLNETQIQPCNSHRFLGVVLDQELRWNQQADHALAKATKWTLAFRRLAGSYTGISMPLMRQLYNAVAIPKVTYAADIWYTPLHDRAGRTNRCGSVGTTNRLTSLQRLAAIAITGALKTTATDVLELHAGILPMQLLMHKVCHRATLRLASLPKSHPLHPILRIRAKRYIKTHRSPLHQLTNIYDISPNEMEVISPVRSPPAYVPRIHTRATTNDPRASRESTGQRRESEIQVFSDGSGIDGKVGAAAILYHRGIEAKVLRYHLGLLTDHTVFEAEATGVLLGIHLIKSMPHANNATIKLDNQAVLAALSIRKPKPAQSIIDEILLQAENVWKSASNPDFILDITWVRGHNGTEGNEKVDVAAKEAARGIGTQEGTLPDLLAGPPLPLSTSALRQTFSSELNNRWKEIWKRSPRHNRLSEIDPTMPSDGFRRLTRELNRAQTSIIIQLRTGHIALNKHLHRITKADSPTCPTCGQDDETVHHYLFDCPTWKHERWSMGRTMGRDSKSARRILNSQRGIKATLKFVGQTKRFQNAR
jgi:ribonuclease HI